MPTKRRKTRLYHLMPGSHCNSVALIVPLGARRGFTLLEVLVSLTVATILLASLGLVVHQTGQELTSCRRISPDMQYSRALDLMTADVRGMIHIEPIEEDISAYGRPLARFTSTHRVQALQDGQWMGSCRIGYWLKDREGKSKQLWRSETSRIEAKAQVIWTSLMDELADQHIELFQNNEWINWPTVQDEQRLITPDSMRFRTTVAASETNDVRQLPLAVISLMGVQRDGPA